MRFIAVNDAVDSAKGDNDFTVIRNVFNDFYAKDTSKKVRAVMSIREPVGSGVAAEDASLICNRV